jgi:glycosyltransferase involved in cell wall biosynthesis
LTGKPVVVLADSFPVLSETFVGAEAHALAQLGRRVAVVAGTPPDAGEAGERADLAVTYLDRAPLARRLRALVRLAGRRPLRCLADLVSRRRWRRAEPVWPLRSLAPLALAAARDRPHLHAHFAGPAALNALRVARICGLRYSVVCHGYDIFRRPMNLAEKLDRSAFTAGTCDYTVERLRALAPSARVERLVMGVDGDRFRRSRPLPGGRTVAGVGRLVEKKGFDVLLRAAAALAARAPLEAVVIVGDGPLRPRLAELARELGIEALVSFTGSLDHARLPALLERADLLAMPCVVAADGDRDSMPVAVKEAMAMELLIAASDEVGLPEVVRAPWGRLAPPGDAAALADAIDGLLALDPEQRAEAGRAGRGFALEHCNVGREAERLSRLIGAPA